MSQPASPLRSATLAALAAGAAVLALQEISAILPPVGAAIRDLPVVAIVLVITTLLIVAQLIRSR
ncbi:MAG: hypothetical protein EBU83_01850 [bacterium]|nr:hypothetical protein [Chloroflexota bacterium]NBO52167.1 hypothetical protein [Candidatus Aquidulcis sp.]